jgi:hypothetical protein
MSIVEAVTFREPWEAERRAAELHLGPVARLLKVAAIANGAGADATPFHPANAAGTLSYQYGTWALRDEFVGEEWKLDRPYGVEAISNEAIKVKVVFQNVDIACNDDKKPQPRSGKGAGAERVSMPNLFGDLPEYVPAQEAAWAIYYLMVDADGAAELTRPIVKGGRFAQYPERIYLSQGRDDLGGKPLALDDGDVADDFDPEVVRK